MKNAIAGEIEKAAGQGRFVSYRELSKFAVEKYPAEFPKNNRRRLIECLDEINHKSRRKGFLLSAIVVNDDGMPDSGFFRKLRMGEWGKIPEDIGRESDEKIFRREASAVFHAHDARVGVLVLIDLQNVPNKNGERDKALNWLGDHANVRGYSFAFPEHRKKLREVRRHRIEKRDVVNSGLNAVDAALLVEFGRKAFRVPERDFVCIMGRDGIYNQAAVLALESGVKVLRFYAGDMDWEPDNKDKGFYRAFNLADPVEEWDAEMDWGAGD